MKKLSSVVFVGLLAGCMTPPPAPPAPYHGRGAQPAWSLIIDEQHVTFIQTGQSVLRDPRPAPATTALGSTYVSPRIRVNIVRTPCRDGATGLTHPDRVQVDIGGRSFHGCGG